jgi:hypothetical protein
VDPPEHVSELRAVLQLYADLRQEHVAWAQRIHATLFHQGVPSLAGQLSDPRVRARLAGAPDEIGLSRAGAEAVQVALRMMDRLEAELAPVHAQIRAFARRQAGCKALASELYGVGPLVAAIIWAFLGDARRFSSSAQAVRHTGLDVTVYSSRSRTRRWKPSARAGLRTGCQPPHQRQAMRNSLCALSDLQALLVLYHNQCTLTLRRSSIYQDALDRRSRGESNAHPGAEPCLKQAVNRALWCLLCFCPAISNSVRCQARKAAANRPPPLRKPPA